MAQNTTITLTALDWTLLTNEDVTTITFQNRSEIHPMLVKATTDTTKPTNDSGAITFKPGEGVQNVAMTALFKGLSGADRVWAYSYRAIPVYVDHDA